MNKNPKAKTKLGQGLLKALKEILDSESGDIVKSEQRITGEAQLKVAEEKIAQLKDSLVKDRNETMKPELRRAARIQVEALIQELEESIRVYEFSRSRK